MNLYASLNDWGLQHPEAVHPFGYLRRRIQWRVLISTDRHPTSPTITAIEIVNLEVTKPGPDKKKEAPLLLVASQGPRSGTQVLAELASDTLKYALPTSLSKQSPRGHQAWRDLLDEAVAGVPSCSSLAVVRDGVDNDLFAAAFAALGTMSKDSQKGHVEFHVDGENPIERPDVLAWWAERAYQDDAKRAGEQVCAATGRTAVVARLIEPVTINGKQETLSSANAEYASHYGRSLGGIATIDTYVAHRAMSALGWLAANRSNSRSLGSKTLVWWTDGPAPDDLESLLACEFSDDDFATELATRRLIGPAETSTVHAILVGTRKGRHYIAATYDAPVSALRAAIGRWQRLTAVIDPKTNLPVHLTLARIARSTERPASGGAVNERRESAVAAVLVSFAYGQISRMPTDLLPKVIASINIHLATPTKGYASLSDPTQAAHIAALQLCLYDPHHDPQESTMPYLNEESDSAAYQLGRYFSVAEKLQRKAMPGIARGLASKRLKDFLRAPRRAFSSLEGDMLPYIDKLTKGGRAPFEPRTLNDIASHIPEIPERFTAAQQAEFHLGRRHQTAHDIAAGAATNAAKEAEAAAKASTPTDATPAEEAA